MTIVVGGLLIAVVASACGSDDDDEPADSSSAAGSAGATKGGSGRAGSGSNAGSGGAAQSSAMDMVTGLEPVDPSFGKGAKGCRRDGDCQTSFVCVQPGEKPPSGCGTACCYPQSMINPQCNPNLTAVPVPMPCSADEQCKLPFVRCDNGQCAHCREDVQCPASAPFCVMSRCTECRTDAECTQDPARPACINGGCFECSLHTQCPAERPRCKGSCVECLATTDCAQGICQNDRCVPECTSDEQCAVPGYPRRCADQRCDYVACASDADCPSWSVCATGATACGAKPCGRDADCLKDAPYCVDGACFRALGACQFGGPFP